MSAPRTTARSEVPTVSKSLLALFRLYLRRYLARHFDALRVSEIGARHLVGPGARHLGDGESQPLVLYTNHPSWWDPIVFGFAVYEMFPGRKLYGPMDAEALEKYGLFRRLGVFGVEQDRRRGAATFLRTSLALLERPETVLWVTAQGDFADARQRPLELRPGVAHLARRRPGLRIVPAAIEYAFWNERLPEALLRFGEPVAVDPDLGVETLNRGLEAALERTMDALAEDVRRRDPRAFHTLLSGRTGVGGLYDVWRRLRARVRGRSFDASHGFGPGEAWPDGGKAS